MKTIKLSLLIGIFAVLSLYSCKKEYESPPELPPIESFITDFSDFNINKALGDSTNWKFAAENVGLWNTLISSRLSVPVASYIEAVNSHTPIYQSDDTWLWEYSFSDLLNNMYTAKLYGTLKTETVNWEMFISKEETYLDFLWYTGISHIDGSKVNWILFDDPHSATKLLSIEYNEISNNTENIKYTNIIPVDTETGAYILYGNDRNTDLNAYYHIFNKGKDNLIEIEWNQTSKNGRVKDFNKFDDNEWHCWDGSLQNTVCE